MKKHKRIPRKFSKSSQKALDGLIEAHYYDLVKCGYVFEYSGDRLYLVSYDQDAKEFLLFSARVKAYDTVSVDRYGRFSKRSKQSRRG